MKKLWAPWRMEYIEQFKLHDRSGKCVFCDSAAQKHDKKTLIILRGKYCFVIFNKYPYTNGHLMVVPYKHTSQFDQLAQRTLTEIMVFSQHSTKILKKAMKPDGFNLGWNIGRVAGAGIKDHVHMHVVPRWDGDTNFMPIVAKVKLLSESLDRTYTKLHPAFKKIKNHKE